MIKQYLILSLLITVNSAKAMEWAQPKINETEKEKKERYDLSHAALLDVWQKGTQSTAFFLAKAQEFSAHPKGTLIRAIEQHNLAQCILHIANGESLGKIAKNKATVLHVAAHNGFYPLCHFLLTIQDEKIDFKQQQKNHGALCHVDLLQPTKDGKTPLHYAILHAHHDVSALLLAHEKIDTTEKLLDILKTLQLIIPFTNLVALYQKLLLDNPQPLFYREARTMTVFQPNDIRLPLLFELGAQPEALDHNGHTFVHDIVHDRLAFHKIDHILNVIPAYQLFLEKRALRTLLLIHRFRKQESPLFACIPKDVLKHHLAPLVRPLSYKKDLVRAVVAQLFLLRKVLSIKSSSGCLPYQYHQWQKGVNPNEVDSLKPDNVEVLHALKIVNRTLNYWRLPYDPRYMNATAETLGATISQTIKAEQGI